MFRRIGFRIYPNSEQEILLAKSFGCARYVYNWALDLKTKTYQTEQKSISIFDVSRELTKKKKEEAFKWLREVPSQTLQESLRNLDSAFTKFFREKRGYPKFKSKDSKQSIRFPQGFLVGVDFIHFPKLGNIKARVSFDTSEFLVKNITISKSKTGKYFAILCYDTLTTAPQRSTPSQAQAIGIDLGIKTFIVTSEAEEIENPKFLNTNLKRVKCLQKRHTRKKKGGKNREKARLKLALKHEKIANQRKDFLHKTSTKLVRENQTICIEDLNVEGMLKNHKLAQAISDVSWSEFVTHLKNKTELHGKNLIIIGRFHPSSKLCECGTLNKDLKLSDRVWICSNCGVENQRDVLAARNIKKFAFLDNPTKFFKEVYSGAGKKAE